MLSTLLPRFFPSSSPSSSPFSLFFFLLLLLELFVKYPGLFLKMDCLLFFLSSLYTSDINFLSDINLTKISPILWASSVSDVVCLAVQKFLNCTRKLLALIVGQMESYSESPFMYLHTSSIHLDLVSVQGDRYYFHSSASGHPVPPTPFVEEISFLQCMFFGIFMKY